MTTMHACFLGFGAAALLAIAGCSTSSSSTVTPEAANAQNSIDTSRGISAPLVLRLKGPEATPSSGDVPLDLEIVTREALSVPVALQLRVPTGASLVSGLPTETLQLSQPGTVLRHYVVRFTGPVTPVVVTADARDPGQAYGLHAERQYPAPTQPMMTPPPGGHPPMARPPMPPR